MSVVGTDRTMSSAGLGRTLRTLRDPLLLFAVPVVFALLLAFVGYGNSWPIGFDFRGTLWEPARALLDGIPIYPEPTREAIWWEPGGLPAFRLPAGGTARAPSGGSRVARVGARARCRRRPRLWLLDVRDWRCYPVALRVGSRPRGRLLGEPLAADPRAGRARVAVSRPGVDRWACRRRGSRGEAVRLAADRLAPADKTVSCGSVGGRLRRRSRARRLGDDRIRGLPRLPGPAPAAPARVRGAKPLARHRRRWARGLSRVAVAVAAAVGAALLVVAAWVARRPDGDRRVFSVVVVASVVATPIVWLHYLALLFVPIAIRWPRLAAAWFFGFVVLLAERLPGIASRCASLPAPPPASSNRRGSGATRRRRGGSPRRCAWSWALSA